jgi:F0F1-type ATP synthase delta subunit
MIYINEIYLSYKQYVNKVFNNIDLRISFYNNDGKYFIKHMTKRLEELKEKHIDLKSCSDSNLISGFKVRVGNFILDNSMDTKLKNLYRLLKKINF